jgi:hypothetical protein
MPFPVKILFILVLSCLVHLLKPIFNIADCCYCMLQISTQIFKILWSCKFFALIILRRQSLTPSVTKSMYTLTNQENITSWQGNVRLSWGILFLWFAGSESKQSGAAAGVTDGSQGVQPWRPGEKSGAQLNNNNCFTPREPLSLLPLKWHNFIADCFDGARPAPHFLRHVRLLPLQLPRQGTQRPLRTPVLPHL